MLHLHHTAAVMHKPNVATLDLCLMQPVFGRVYLTWSLVSNHVPLGSVAQPNGLSSHEGSSLAAILSRTERVGSGTTEIHSLAIADVRERRGARVEHVAINGSTATMTVHMTTLT